MTNKELFFSIAILISFSENEIDDYFNKISVKIPSGIISLQLINEFYYLEYNYQDIGQYIVFNDSVHIKKRDLKILNTIHDYLKKFTVQHGKI